MARKVRVPRLFAVELPARVFEGRILRRIYISSDREFLESLYLRQPEGSYRRAESVEMEVARRLRELARAVTQNKGVVRLGKISVIAVVVAALLVFNLLFRDRLAEAGLERALEGIFSARVEIDDLRLRLLRGRVSFHRLAVADQEQPMRNLLELGRSVLSLDTPQLLRGRVLIRTLESREIRWDTPRDSSGDLRPRPGQPEPLPAEEEKDRRLSLPGLDVGALLDQQAQNLRSPAAAAALNARAEALGREWGNRLDANEQTLRRLSDQVEALRSLDAGSVRTMPEAQRALSQVQGLYPTLQSAKQQVTELKQELAADTQGVARTRGSLAALVEADAAYLRSLTDLTGAGFRGLLAAIIAPQLERYLGRFSKYALRAVQYALRLGSREPEGKQEPDRKARRSRGQGREVPFPVRQFPRFLLQNMDASFGPRGEAYSVRFSLQNLSSDPELTAAPVSFAADLAREDRTLAVAGRLDLRSGAQERVSAGLESFGQPLELSEGLEIVKLRQVKGRYDLRSDLSLGSGGDFRGGGRLAVRDLVLDTIGESDAISAAVYDAVSSAQELTVDFRFASEGGRLRVTAATNLDDLLSARLTQSLAALGSQYEQRVRDELRRRLEGELARNESLQGSLTALQARAGGSLQDIAGYETLLAQKRGELETRLKKLGGSALKGLTEGLPLP